MYNTVVAYAARGGAATLEDISTALNNESWVYSAVVNGEPTNVVGDITVTVNEGYVYQVYYDAINRKDPCRVYREGSKPRRR